MEPIPCARVRRLESNCNYDYIQVFDGPALSSPLIARVCHGSRDSFTSSSNFMSIRFVSDGSVTRSGFQAEYYSRPSSHSTSKCQALGAGCLPPPPGTRIGGTPDQSRQQVRVPDLLPEGTSGRRAQGGSGPGGRPVTSRVRGTVTVS